jgi:N-acetylmuramic acid 6-phosphate etherase
MTSSVTGPGAPDGELLGELSTEQARPGLERLDTWPTEAIVDALLGSQAAVTAVLAGAREQLLAAVEVVASALHAGGRLVYVGAGTAGRVAALDAVECRPTFGVSGDRVVAVLAGGATASDEAFEAAEDDIESARSALAELDLESRDVVIGVTASGRTPFVAEAFRIARAKGCVTVAVTNNLGTVAAGLADHAVELLTGPEVIAGSTRLAAATAQKIALNTISSAAFVRCGRTYGAWMAGMQPTNDKLRARALRILEEASGRDEADVEHAMLRVDQPDLALVMLVADVDSDEARRRLTASAGHIRTAVERTLEP